MTDDGRTERTERTAAVDFCVAAADVIKWLFTAALVSFSSSSCGVPLVQSKSESE